MKSKPLSKNNEARRDAFLFLRAQVFQKLGVARELRTRCHQPRRFQWAPSDSFPRRLPASKGREFVVNKLPESIPRTVGKTKSCFDMRPDARQLSHARFG